MSATKYPAIPVAYTGHINVPPAPATMPRICYAVLADRAYGGSDSPLAVYPSQAVAFQKGKKTGEAWKNSIWLCFPIAVNRVGKTFALLNATPYGGIVDEVTTFSDVVVALKEARGHAQPRVLPVVVAEP